jgi:hypothetical protein
MCNVLIHVKLLLHWITTLIIWLVDNNSGNESKFCTTSKQILSPRFLSKKHMYLSNFPDFPKLFLCMQNPGADSYIEEQNHLQPKSVINKWVERCETEEVLRKSSANFQWDGSPGAIGQDAATQTKTTLTQNLVIVNFRLYQNYERTSQEVTFTCLWATSIQVKISFQSGRG